MNSENVNVCCVYPTGVLVWDDCHLKGCRITLKINLWAGHVCEKSSKLG